MSITLNIETEKDNEIKLTHELLKIKDQENHHLKNLTNSLNKVIYQNKKKKT